MSRALQHSRHFTQRRLVQRRWRGLQPPLESSIRTASKSRVAQRLPGQFPHQPSGKGLRNIMSPRQRRLHLAIVVQRTGGFSHIRLRLGRLKLRGKCLGPGANRIGLGRHHHAKKTENSRRRALEWPSVGANGLILRRSLSRKVKGSGGEWGRRRGRASRGVGPLL